MTAPTETPPEAVERLRKLLRLSRSDNANEAAVAAAAAQRLMTRYSIDSSLLVEPAANGRDTELPPETFGRHVVYERWGPLPTWLMFMASDVVEASGLYPAYSSGQGHSVYLAYGPAAEAALIRESLTHLVNEVERLATEGQARMGPGMGRSYWSSWRVGCAQTIGQRVKQAAREAREERRRELTGPTLADYQAAAGNPEVLLALDAAQAAPRYSLAVVETALARLDKRPERIKAWLNENVKFKAARPRKVRTSGLEDGRRAGYKARLR